MSWHNRVARGVRRGRVAGVGLLASVLVVAANGTATPAVLAEDSPNCTTGISADGWSLGACMGGDGHADVYVNRVGRTGWDCRIDATFGYERDETPGYTSLPCRPGHYDVGDVVTWPGTAGVTTASISVDGRSIQLAAAGRQTDFVASPAVAFWS